MRKVSESLIGFDETPTASGRVSDLADRILKTYKEIRTSRGASADHSDSARSRPAGFGPERARGG